MLTCEELDEFVEKLCDLTRMMDGMDRVREATELLGQIESVPQKFLMQWRAATVADLHYLQGESLRDIARRLGGPSFQSVSYWLRDHGPTQFLVLTRDDDGVVRPSLIDIDGELTKPKIKQLRSAGRRVVPSVLNALDPQQPDQLRKGTDLEKLWHELDDC